METKYNFSAGPAMLPVEVMQKVQQSLLNYKNTGFSIIEISHRSSVFIDLLEETNHLFRTITNLPDNYSILYMPGGAQMQFSAIPLNLLPTQESIATYYETGYFAKVANQEASKYGTINVIGQANAKTKYKTMPSYNASDIENSEYVYITSNNTIFGTKWASFPATQTTPLVVDATSDILSQPLNMQSVGILFASMQKNLGPAGLTLVLCRKDLLQKTKRTIPKLLNYSIYDEQQSMPNTINTFAIYVFNLVLQWLQERGGLEEVAKYNTKKAQLLYQYIDQTNFYQNTIPSSNRSTMNVVFTTGDQEKDTLFIREAEQNGLYFLKGHRVVGGVRASIYNAMPLEACQKLLTFMEAFENKYTSIS